MRLEAGAGFVRSDASRGSIALFHDGVGAEDYDSTGIRLQLSYRFN